MHSDLSIVFLAGMLVCSHHYKLQAHCLRPICNHNPVAANTLELINHVGMDLQSADVEPSR